MKTLTSSFLQTSSPCVSLTLLSHRSLLVSDSSTSSLSGDTGFPIVICHSCSVLQGIAMRDCLCRTSHEQYLSGFRFSISLKVGSEFFSLRSVSHLYFPLNCQFPPLLPIFSGLVCIYITGFQDLFVY